MLTTAPFKAFTILDTVINSPQTRPIRDILYFVSGVILLKYYGDDLAV